jgi:hypothetical protein
MKPILILIATLFSSLPTTQGNTGRYYIVESEKDSLVLKIETDKSEISGETFMRDLELNYEPKKKKKLSASVPKKPKKTSKAPKTTTFHENKTVVVKGRTIQPSQAFSLRSNSRVIDALAPGDTPSFESVNIYKQP